MGIVGLCITIILLTAGFIKKKSIWLFGLQCIWFWILHGLSNGGMDYAVSEIIYLNGGSETEWLSRLIIKLFQGLGMNYLIYHAVLSMAAVGIFAYVVLRISKNPCMVSSLYFVFLLYDNVIQKRYFLASMLVLLALYFFTKGKQVLFYVIIVLAIGFHVSSVVYLLFPLTAYIIKKNSKVKLIFLFILELLFYNYIPHILMKFGALNLYTKYMHYVGEENYSSFVVGVAFFALYTFLWLTVYYIGYYWKSKNICDTKIFEINKIMLFILVFLLANSNFTRYFRPVLILDYGFIGNRFSDKLNKRTLSALAAYGFVLAVFVGAAAWMIGTEGVTVLSIYENNWLLQKLFM